MKRHSTLFFIGGLLLGVSAPVGWAAIRLLFFYDSDLGFFEQIFHDIIKDGEHFALTRYGGGHRRVLAVLGYMIGGRRRTAKRRQSWTYPPGSQRTEEIFENRYRCGQEHQEFNQTAANPEVAQSG